MLGGLLDAYNMNLETSPLTAKANNNGKGSERTFSNADNKENPKTFLMDADSLELGSELESSEILETEGLSQDISQGIANLLKNRSETSQILKELPEFVKQALEGAKLENNQAARQIAVLRFNAGMSISKEVLMHDLKLTGTFGKDNISAIVNLERIGIEVNETNIEGFNSVMNTEGQLLELIDDVIENIVDTVIDDVSNVGREIDVVEIEQNNTEIKNTEESVEAESKVLEKAILESETSESNITASEISESKVTDSKVTDSKVFENESTKVLERQTIDKDTIENETIERKISDRETYDNSIIKSANKDTQIIDNHIIANKNEENVNLERANRFLDKVGISLTEEEKSFISEGGNETKERLKHVLQKKLLLKPELVSSKEKLDKYFKETKEKIDTISKEIKHLKEKQVYESAKNTNKVSSNLRFVSALNKFINYVELPLKLTEGEAKGELYVYTRKGTKTIDSDNASIYIDLELPKLKTLGILVRLSSGKHLSVSFMSDSERGRELIKESVPDLVQEFSEMGYSVVTDITTLEAKGSEIKEFLDATMKQSLKLSEFDVKA